MTALNKAKMPLSVGSLYRILYFCRLGTKQAIDLNEDVYKIEVTHNGKSPFEEIAKEVYDLILLDDDLFGDDIYMIILELKRWDWSLPIVVLTSEEEVAYQTNLMEAGADDILVKGYSQKSLAQRLKLCLTRKEQNHRLIHTNRKLYEIMMLTRQLRTFTDPSALIQDTIKTVCDLFSLYGIAIAIPEDGIVRIYSGCKSEQAETMIMQSLRDAKPNEPLTHTFETGLIELFDDISKDSNYIALPNLPLAQSVLILPLQYQADTLGTMAIFGEQNYRFNTDDLRTYEILATQFTLALQNAYFNHAQYQDIQSSQGLLKAWQSIFRVETSQEVAKTLCALVGGLQSVAEVMIWIEESGEAQPEVFTTGKYENAQQILTELLKQDDFIGSILQTDRDLHSIFKVRLSPIDPLQPLFRALHSRHLIFIPLEDSARLIGGILVSSTSERRFELEDANRLKNLALAAGQALERIMLIEAMTDKSGRLEAILRSVTEGIFFVDDSGRIRFCNPQVTEITNVNPSEIIGNKLDILIGLLAGQATDPDKVTADFRDAVRSLEASPRADRKYPIVELTLRNSGHRVDVEFVVTDDFRASKQSWVGLVRIDTHAHSKWESPPEAIDLLMRTLHTTDIELQHMIEQPSKSSNRSSIVDETPALREIKKGIANSEVMLEQYSRFNNLDLTESHWNYQIVDLGQLFQNIIQVHFAEMQTRIVSEATTGRFCVESNKQLVEWGLSRLLENVIKRTYDDDIINVRMKDAGDEISIRIESAGTFDLRDAELTLFDLVELDDPACRESDIYLYLALMHFYRCRVAIETVPNKGRSLLIVFPKSQSRLVPSLGPTDSAYLEAVVPTPTPRREPEAVMLLQGRSGITKRIARELEHKNFGLYVYRSSEEALRDLNLTRLDLIVLDGSLIDEDTAQLCKKFRSRSEVPIVIAADKASNEERIEAFKAGAEDYITEPISKEELLAKINVLFKRQHLAERTEQPLDLDDLRIDFARRTVFINHKSVVLTRIEYDLLRTLVANMGQVLTHQQLLEKVWGPEHRSETQYLWVHLSRLRKKLEPTSYIHNQQGIGYIFQKN